MSDQFPPKSGTPKWKLPTTATVADGVANAETTTNYLNLNRLALHHKASAQKESRSIRPASPFDPSTPALLKQSPPKLPVPFLGFTPLFKARQSQDIAPQYAIHSPVKILLRCFVHFHSVV